MCFFAPLYSIPFSLLVGVALICQRTMSVSSSCAAVATFKLSLIIVTFDNVAVGKKVAVGNSETVGSSVSVEFTMVGTGVVVVGSATVGDKVDSVVGRSKFSSGVSLGASDAAVLLREEGAKSSEAVGVAEGTGAEMGALDVEFGDGTTVGEVEENMDSPQSSSPESSCCVRN